MTEQTFEQYAAEVEQKVIDQQVADNSVSFVEHQTRAWESLQHWWVEAQQYGAPPETANGPGSTQEATEDVRPWLESLLVRYGIKTMLDAPCGDWNWMTVVNLRHVQYTGWDSSQWLVDRCVEQVDEHQHPDAIFERVNLLTVPELPAYDLILCRDFLAHLPTNNVVSVLQKFKDSGSKYLLTSHYPDADNTFVYKPQDFTYFGYVERPVNMEADPFRVGRKIDAIEEQQGPGGVISQLHELALFELNV